MLRKPFLLKIYEAASMQRWNDQIRPVELTELDKQAHKMIIAYCLGKYEQERKTKSLDWQKIIEGGLFEFLQRIELTDIKPPLFHRIKENRDKYTKLNKWVYERIKPTITPLGEDFCLRFKNYLFSEETDINRTIISAAHFYATKWEFDIIRQANPCGYLISEIEEDLKNKQSRYLNLESMQHLLSSEGIKTFINICGQLRFQIRWSHLHRVPKTSVLGHMLIVAIFSYLFSLQKNFSKVRAVNNYFTGLFHDLPEVLTRDIINPVKRSVEGLKSIIQEYEQREMERKVYKLLPPAWKKEMKFFTHNEFTEIKDKSKNIIRDGDLLKAADDLTAFIETYLSLKNGIENESLSLAKFSLREKYRKKNIKGIDFEQIYADFD